jgi:tRNA(fMet)-specific endonuclease VapC
MTSYFLDTNAISHVMRNPRGAVGVRLSAVPDGHRLVSSIVVAEISFGLRKSGTTTLKERANRILRHFDVVPFTAEDGPSYARLRTSLEQDALPFDANDALIAAQAITRGYVVVTHDQQMHDFPGLATADWQ